MPPSTQRDLAREHAEAVALLREYAESVTEEPEFPDSLLGRVDAFLERIDSAPAGDGKVVFR